MIKKIIYIPNYESINKIVKFIEMGHSNSCPFNDKEIKRMNKILEFVSEF